MLSQPVNLASRPAERVPRSVGRHLIALGVEHPAAGPRAQSAGQAHTGADGEGYRLSYHASGLRQASSSLPAFLGVWVFVTVKTRVSAPPRVEVTGAGSRGVGIGHVLS
ncbi:hypothetical protein GCM10009863_43300 [Streptomyces axinellae]|uniref:Uncharacterized protein n=1 Tax=Streptomyces axinellae TaxID=552788 RepID=A0ABP6CQX6_9ACTN